MRRPAAMVWAACVAVAVASAGSAGGDPVLEGEFRSFPAPTYVRCVQSRDLDHDGHADVLATSGAALCVYRGTADGRLESRTDYAAPTTLSGLALGDVDGDGIDDAVARGTADVTVWSGRADGTFASPHTVACDGAGTQLAVGDVDGDGFADVLVPAYAFGGLIVLHGGADGAFDTSTVVIDHWALSVAVGDLDHDGRADLVIGTDWQQVEVLLNRGDGSWQAMPELIAVYQTLEVHLADLNRDGQLDITGVISGGWGIEHFFGRGDGTFGQCAADPVGSYATGFAVGDVSGDGWPDWVFGVDHRVAVALNDGRGARRVAPYSLACGASPSTMALGDVNGDGWADIVCGSAGKVEVVLNRGADPWFASLETVLPVNAPGTPLRFADLDGDGIPEILGSIGSTGWLGVFRQTAGRYAYIGEYEAPYVRDVAVLDLDRDGHADVVGLCGDRLCTWKGHGDATLGARSDLLLSSSGRMAVGDVDRDGLADVVVGVSGGIATLSGTAAGGFGAPRVSVVSGNVDAIALGDLDRDGRLDAVVTTTRVCVLRGRGDGTFEAATCGGDFGSTQGTPLVTDVDGDSLPDVLVLDGARFQFDVMRGLGDGRLGAATGVPVGNWPGEIATGDLDGDGHADVVVSNVGDGTVSIAYGNGDGTFRRDFDLGVAPSPQMLAIADVDGDGVPDVATGTPLTLLVNRAVRVDASVATGVGGFVRTPPGPYHPAGTPVTIRAVPDSGWEFASWNGLGDTQNPAVVTPVRDTALVAHFRDDGTHVVRVLSPNGGEAFAGGQLMTVLWSSTGAFGADVRADILLARDGVTYQTLAHDLVDTGSWTWTVTGTSTLVDGHAQSTARIRVVVHSAAAGSWWDDSDAGFSLGDVASAGRVTLLYPNGGEAFTLGDLVTIRWTSSLLQPGGTSVDLYVAADSTAAGVPIALGVPNDGACTWPVLGPASNHGVTPRYTARLRIVVRDPFAGIARDTSDAGFSVFSWQADAVEPAVPVAADLVVLGASPASGALRLRVDVPAASPVRIAMFDALGRRVATVTDGTLGAGRHVVAWSRPDGVRPGVYFARGAIGDRTFVHRCVLLE